MRRTTKAKLHDFEAQSRTPQDIATLSGFQKALTFHQGRTVRPEQQFFNLAHKTLEEEPRMVGDSLLGLTRVEI